MILVDELAHTSAGLPTQAVAGRLELVGAGFSVYTTMNVQHVESSTTSSPDHGVIVRETVA